MLNYVSFGVFFFSKRQHSISFKSITNKRIIMKLKKTYNIHHVDNVLYDLILNKDTFSVRVNFR